MKPRLAALFLILLFSAQAQPQPPEKASPVSLRELSASLEELSNKVRHAVVQVFSTGYVTAEEGEGTTTGLLSKQRSTGSGVFVSPDGYIVTNSHVVRGARRIQVRLAATRRETPGHHSILQASGRLLDAKLVGIDRETDLAVLRIAGAQMPYLALGDSDDLRQGQLVMAFGNPLGLEGTVTMGIVSSVARQIKPDDPMIYIQTDAPINPGNSGGPLIDSQGRVMGINTFILTQSGGSEGIGFAIPSNIVRTVYEQIRREGHVHRGQIGIYAQTISPALVKGLNLPRDWGALVADVDPDGPANEAGVKVGDIIVSLNGKPIENARQLQVNVYGHRMNETVALELLRGKDTVKVDVPVLEAPGDPERFADLVNPEDNLVAKLGGLLCIGIDKKLAAMLPELRNPYGVVVAAGSTNDLGSGTGLRPGDVIYSVNGDPVTSVAALKKKLDEFKPGESPVLQIERDGRLMFVAIEME